MPKKPKTLPKAATTKTTKRTKSDAPKKQKVLRVGKTQTRRI